MTAAQGVQERAFAAALRAAKVKPEDGAAVALARKLAKALDEAGSVSRLEGLAREYRQVLVQLAMTPQARAERSVPQVAEAPKRSALQQQRDDLKALREKRAEAGA